MKLLTYLTYTLLFTTVLSCGAPVSKDKTIDTLNVQNPDSIVKYKDTSIVLKRDTIINDTI